MEEQIWDFYEASRTQRKTEIQRGLGHEGTQGYEDRGCYKCNGFNENCEIYNVQLKTNNQ